MSPPPGVRKPPQKPTDIKKSLKNILFLLKDYKLKLVLTVICAVLSTAFSVIGPLIIGWATTIIYDGTMKIINHTGSIDFNLLINMLIIATILYIISGVFSYLQSYLLVEVSTDISYNIRQKAIEKITMLSMDNLESGKRGDILSRITNDVDSLQTGINSTFNQFLTAVITIIGVLVMMFSINLWMSLASVILIPITFVVLRTVTKHSQSYFKDQLTYKGSVNAQIEENFTGHDIIRAFNHEENSFNRFKIDNNKWYTHEWKSQFFSSLTGPVMNFISNLAYVIIAVLGAVLVIEKAIAVGDILAFFQYIKNFTQPIQQVTRVMNLLQTAMAASERIFEFLEIPDEENPNTLKITDIKDEISFENVSFGYGSEKVINDLSFNVKKGEKIAIIGETGAGKSTIVKLLMRFYDVDSGAIKIDGRNINDFDKNSLRSLMGMVLQETWLFSDTIANNIRYGNLESSDSEVIEVAKQVYADDFIKHLPEGYETVLNEDSDNISHGQKQLLTIARTVLSNKKILILDEATSSVDTRTEKLIQKAMDKLLAGKTSFIIAHRLSTIKDADNILVIDNGEIVESGTHDDLLSIKGVYYNTLMSQFTEELDEKS